MLYHFYFSTRITQYIFTFIQRDQGEFHFLVEGVKPVAITANAKKRVLCINIGSGHPANGPSCFIKYGSKEKCLQYAGVLEHFRHIIMDGSISFIIGAALFYYFIEVETIID